MTGFPSLQILQKEVQAAQAAQEAKVIPPILDTSEKIFCAYTQQEAKSKKSKLDVGDAVPGVDLVFSLFLEVVKGISLEEAQTIVDNLNSLVSGKITRKQIDTIVAYFLDKASNIVDDYTKTLFNEKKAFKTFRKQYCGGDDDHKYTDEEKTLRQTSYNQLMAASAAPTEAQLSKYLNSDLSGEGTLRFPVLDFYLVLLAEYEKKNPEKAKKLLAEYANKHPGSNPKTLPEFFIKMLSLFILRSYEFAKSSPDSFDNFDAKMRAIDSIGKKVTAPDSLSSQGKR